MAQKTTIVFPGRFQFLCVFRRSMVSLYLLIVIAFCISGMHSAERNPGLAVQYTEKYLRIYHQDILLGKELDKKLIRGFKLEIAEKISTTFWSTLRVTLMNLAPTGYQPPEVNVSISPAEGVNLKVFLPKVTLKGTYTLEVYNYLWFQQSITGEVTLSILGTSLTMLREIMPSYNREQYKWQSSECYASVDDVDIDLHDPMANSILSLVNLEEEIIAFQQNFCGLPKYFLDIDVDLTYKITEDIYIDMSLIRQPLIHSGYIEFHHMGELRYKGDNEQFMGLRPPAFILAPPKRMIVYWITEFLFNSLGYVIYQHKLISYSYTKADLPEGREHLLDTTCEEECFGELFPNAAMKFPNSTVEITLSTAEPLTFRVTSGKLKVNLIFDISINASSQNATSCPLFTIRLSLSASVGLRVFGNRVKFDFREVAKNITVTESSIGELREDALLTVVGVAFQKVLAPFLAHGNRNGFSLGVIDPLLIGEYEFHFKKSNGVSLMVDLLNTEEKKAFVHINDLQKKPRFFMLFALVGNVVAGAATGSKPRAY